MVRSIIAALIGLIRPDGAKHLARAEKAGKKVQRGFEKAGQVLVREQVKLENAAIILKSKASTAEQNAKKAIRVAGRYSELHS